MYRCDVPQDKHTGPGFLFPGFARRPRRARSPIGAPPPPRSFTDPRLGRLPRTLVNRVWQRLLGRGIVANVDEMDGEPWSPALLDWLAADFVEHGYDIKHLIETIVTSRAYQMPAVPRDGRAAGPRLRLPRPGGPAPDRRAVRRRHRRDHRRVERGAGRRRPGAGRPQADAAAPPPSQPTVGRRRTAREWRAPSIDADARARPADPRSDHSMRATDATTLQALELTNGEVLRAGWRAARGGCSASCRPTRSAATRAPWPAGTPPRARFDIDVAGVTRLWLVVEDTGSNVPEALLPAWARRRAGRPGRRRRRSRR